MGTVVFDFDSTLIQVESLEEILAARCLEKPGLEHQIRAITEKGMAGEISFAQSLQQRLTLAAPSLADVEAFGRTAYERLTPGMADLVKSLILQGNQVHIVSGGLYEAIMPLALSLGIPAAQVHAVRLKWDPAGEFDSIDPSDPFSLAKTEGVKPWLGQCPAPRIAVGDGMTDYHLFRDGFVNHFVVFTQHVRRTSVLATGAPEAPDVPALALILEKWLWHNKNTP